MEANAKQTDYCVYLFTILLVGLVLNAAMNCGGQTRFLLSSWFQSSPKKELSP
jgi:hypothetical protein